LGFLDISFHAVLGGDANHRDPIRITLSLHPFLIGTKFDFSRQFKPFKGMGGLRKFLKT